MSITEAHMILPIRDNEGVILQDETGLITYMILNEFGGFSASDIRGCWRDQATGKVYHDCNTLYVIAADWSKHENRYALFEIAQLACAKMRQECIYLCVKGVVQFISNPDAITREQAA